MSEISIVHTCLISIKHICGLIKNICYDVKVVVFISHIDKYKHNDEASVKVVAFNSLHILTHTYDMNNGLVWSHGKRSGSVRSQIEMVWSGLVRSGLSFKRSGPVWSVFFKN